MQWETIQGADVRLAPGAIVLCACVLAVACGLLSGCADTHLRGADAGPEPSCGAATYDHDADPTTPCMAWTVCEAGEHVDVAGSEVSDRTCTACPEGTYSDAPNRDECTAQPWEWATYYGHQETSPGGNLAVRGDGDLVVQVGFTLEAFAGFTNAGQADFYVQAFDGSGTPVWTEQWGTAGWDSAKATALDSQGAIYVVGHVEGALPGMTWLGDADSFLRKYDADGVVLWTRQFGTSGGDYAERVAIDAADNIYVVGNTTGAFPGFTNAGEGDAFVRKYDASGAELWTRQFGGGSWDRADVVATLDDTHLYVVGSEPPSDGTVYFDVFVRKWDSTGAEVWARTLSSDASDHAHDATVDGAGNVVIVGHTDGALPGHVRPPESSAFVWAWSASGEELWGTQYGGERYASADATRTDDQGNFYVTGTIFGSLDGQLSRGDGDAYVRLFDASGNVLWTRQFGSVDSDGLDGLELDDAGRVYVSGTTVRTMPGEVTMYENNRFVMRLNPVSP